MSFGNWFRQLFSPSSGARSGEDATVLHEEYPEDESYDRPEPGSVVAGGVGGLAGIESAEAAEAEEAELEAPPDPAP